MNDLGLMNRRSLMQRALVLAGASVWYYLAALVMGAILLFEHRIVDPEDLGRVNVAFFDANMWLALTMLLGVVMDVTWRTLT